MTADDDDPDWGSSFDAALSREMESALSSFLGERGAMLEAFVGMVNFVRPSGERAFSVFSPDDQLHVTTESMTSYMHAWNTEITRLNIHDHLMRHHDDDDE